MAEFCKQCFINNLMNASEYRKYEAGELRIVETAYDDICEGCGEITKVVDCVEDVE